MSYYLKLKKELCIWHNKNRRVNLSKFLMKDTTKNTDEFSITSVSNDTNTDIKGVDNKVNSASKMVSSVCLALVPVALMAYF